MTAEDKGRRRWADRSDREGANRERALRERQVREKAEPEPKPEPKAPPLFDGADDPPPAYERD
jgi:hypothetical protein